jgi:KEOPS complex subunit Pcc1
MPTQWIGQPKTHKESEILVSIDFPSPKIAQTIFSSVAPETQQTPGYRSLTKLEANGCALTMRIQAQDLVALRAASNSFLRFIAASFRAIEVVAPFYRTRQVPDRPAQKT